MSDSTPYRADWPEHAATLLPSWARYLDAWRAFAAGLGAGAQVVEDLVADLLASSPLDTASPAYLERWGEIVGEPRGSLTTAEHRAILRARIVALRSRGRPDDVIRTMQAATAPSIVRLFYTPPGYVVQARRADLLRDVYEARVARVLDSARMPGTSLEAWIGYLDSAGVGPDPEIVPLDAGVFARRIL